MPDQSSVANNELYQILHTLEVLWLAASLRGNYQFNAGTANEDLYTGWGVR